MFHFITRNSIIDEKFDEYRKRYFYDIKIENFDEAKQFLIKIISHPDYEKYINAFNLTNDKIHDKNEDAIWHALSKSKKKNTVNPGFPMGLFRD